jgi:hypothetical protein
MMSRRIAVVAAMIVTLGSFELARPEELQAATFAGCAACLSGVQCDDTEDALVLCAALQCDHQDGNCGNFGNCQLPSRLLSCFTDAS